MEITEALITLKITCSFQKTKQRPEKVWHHPPHTKVLRAHPPKRSWGVSPQQKKQLTFPKLVVEYQPPISVRPTVHHKTYYSTLHVYPWTNRDAYMGPLIHTKLCKLFWKVPASSKGVGKKTKQHFIKSTNSGGLFLQATQQVPTMCQLVQGSSLQAVEKQFLIKRKT